MPQFRSLGADERPSLLGLSSAELDEALTHALRELGQPSYRARQIRNWLYARTPATFSDMRDLPAVLRTALEERFVLHPLRSRRALESEDGTRKFLWDLDSKLARTGVAPAETNVQRMGSIESVLIPDGDRVTYCISTQAGCPVKCTFCATGYGGYEGNLDAGEIVDQVLRMRLVTGEPPTNLVYMGMGEPLLNFEAVSRSIEVLTGAEQVGFGARRITVSTVGVPERIRELAHRHRQVKLALSLHAADDRLRSEIIPLNRKWPLAEVLSAVREHTRVTGKQVTFEYVLLPGVNDSPEDATRVAHRIEGIPSSVNLIGFNPFRAAPYEKPSLRSLMQFRAALESRYPGAVTVRRSRGEDIQGACGQLSLDR